MYALERGLTGSFELSFAGASAGTVLVVQGAPAKVRTSDTVHVLGEVLLDLGFIRETQRLAAVDRANQHPQLLGQALLELGALDDDTLQAGLRAQVDRKLEHLFQLPQETEFAYYDAVDLLEGHGGTPTPIDPFPCLWRGTRQSPSWEHVDAALQRLGSAGVRLAATAQVERFLFEPGEAELVELLRARPYRLADLAAASTLGPSLTQLLVYTLVITKQVDLLDLGPAIPAAESPPAPEVSASAAPAPPSPEAPPAPEPAAAPAASSPSMKEPSNPLTPTQGQAFARVQLTSRQVNRAPLVVEEVSVSNVADSRASMSPPRRDMPSVEPAPPPPVISERPPDLLGLISETVGVPPAPASVPRAPASAPGAVAPPSRPGGPSSSRSGPSSAGIRGVSMSEPPLPLVTPVPPPPLPGAPAHASAPAIPASSPSPLTAEQGALKAKIVERALKIETQNYFEMLGLDPEAPTEAVQKAYINLAKVWHPDRLPIPLAEVREACSKVFSHLTEAHTTLVDPKKRDNYKRLLKEGGATPEDQARIQAVLEAATEFQKAEIVFKRNDVTKAQEHAKRAVMLDPEQVEYMVLLTWLESMRPESQTRDQTLEKIATLDVCVQKRPTCERAYFYRAMLYKRLDDADKAFRDFKKVSELNPKNVDAMREVRLYTMRAAAKTPGAKAGSKPPPPQGAGGLLGRLFKK